MKKRYRKAEIRILTKYLPALQAYWHRQGTGSVDKMQEDELEADIKRGRMQELFARLLFGSNDNFAV